MASFTITRLKSFDHCERQDALDNSENYFIQAIAIGRMFINEECLKEEGQSQGYGDRYTRKSLASPTEVIRKEGKETYFWESRVAGPLWLTKEWEIS